jgi:hypothetical protein
MSNNNNLNFEKVIEALKEDKRVAREGWNIKKAFIYLVKDDVVLKTYYGDTIWIPSINDLLAEDWVILQ